MKQTPLENFVIFALLLLLYLQTSAQHYIKADKLPEPRFLTKPQDANDYWPGFTADGKKIFFSRQKQGQKWELFQVPVSGGEAQVFWSGNVGATRASAAPDGQIAFTGIGPGQPASLWLTDSVATTPRQVMIRNLTGNPFYPSWYPGYKQVAIVSYQGERGGNIVKVDLQSGQSQTLTDPAVIRCGMPFVSPDGKTIAFAGQRPTADNVYDQTRNSIWLRSEDGTLKQLSPGQGRAPVWSPDGRWVAYESTEGSATGKYAIYIISADGNINKQVTAFEWNANHPVFSPDSKWLVVSAHHSDAPARTGIAVIPVDLAGLAN